MEQIRRGVRLHKHATFNSVEPILSKVFLDEEVYACAERFEQERHPGEYFSVCG